MKFFILYLVFYILFSTLFRIERLSEYKQLKSHPSELAVALLSISFTSDTNFTTKVTGLMMFIE